MAITYIEITDNQKLQVADIMQKIESIKGELADIQTARATAEIEWSADEQELRTEENKLLQDIRNVRKATVEKAL